MEIPGRKGYEREVKLRGVERGKVVWRVRCVLFRTVDR